MVREDIIATGVDSAAKVANTATTNLLTVASNKLAAAMAKVDAFLTANAFAIAAAGAAALIYGIYKIVTYESDLEKAIKKTRIEIENEKDKTIELFTTLKNAKQGTEEFKNAKETLLATYGKYIPEQYKELQNLGLINAAQVLVNRAIAENIALKTKTEYTDSISTNYNEKIQGEKESALENIRKSKGLDVSADTRYRLDLWIQKVKQGDITTTQFYDAWNALLGKLNIKDNSTSSYLMGITTNLRNFKTETKSANKAYSEFIKSASKDGKKDLEAAPVLPDIQQQIDKANKIIIEAEAKRKTLMAKNSTATPEDIRSQEEIIKKAKDDLATLTGIKEKAQKAADEKAQRAKEEATRAIEELQRKHIANLEEFANAENNISSQRISSMKDGIEKEKAQSQLEYKNRIKAIDRDKEVTLKELNQAAGIKLGSKDEIKDFSGKGLTGNIKSLVIQAGNDDSEKRINAKKDEEIRDLAIDRDYAEKVKEIQRELDDYRLTGIEKEKAAVKDKYDSEIKKLLEARNEKNASEIDSTINGVEEMRTKSNAQIDAKYALERLDTEEQLEYAMNDLKARGINRSEQLDKLNFETWKKIQMQKLAIIIATDPEATKKVPQIAAQINAATANNDESEQQKKLAKIAGKINEISQAAVEAGNAVANMFDSFGNDKLASDLETATELISSVGQTGQGVARIMSGDIVGGVKDVITGVANFVGTLNKLHDKKYEKDIQALQKQVDILKISYDDLGKSIAKAYSNTKSNLISQETENLKKQNDLLRRQNIDEANKKKKDQGKIDANTAQIKANNEQIIENKDLAVEAIMGSDIASAIDEFANAYADAWSAGTDAAKASTDVVASLIRTSIITMLKDKLAPQVHDFMTELSKDIADGVINAEEQARLDALTAGMTSTSNQFLGTTGNLIKNPLGTAASSTLVGSIQRDITEQTAGELAGIFRKVSDDTRRLVINTNTVIDFNKIALNHFSGIELNTFNTVEELKRLNIMVADIKADVSTTAKNTKPVTTKGVGI